MKKKIIAVVLVAVFLSTPGYTRMLFLDDAKPAPKAKPVYRPSRTVVKQSSETGGNLMKTIVLQYIDAKEMKDSMANILGGEGAISVNEQLNAVIVKANSKNMQRIEDLLGQTDKPPLQVQVEAKILEVKTGNGDAASPSTFGWSWQYLSKPGSDDLAQFFGTASPSMGATSAGLYAQLLTGNASAYLSALERLSGLDVIASPWISALNHQPAEIFIGGKIGYKTLLTTTTGTLQDIRYLESGTKLKFIPHITDDGYIKMTIYPSISEGMLSTDGLPISTVTETSNSVLVKDGQTIVIGGLTKNSNSKVEIGIPYLSAIPFFGSFFKRTELVAQKRDIMVLITPHIMTPERIKELYEKAKSMEEKQSKKVDDTRLIY